MKMRQQHWMIILLAAFVMGIGGYALTSQEASGQGAAGWKFDGAHSFLHFRITHAGVAPAYGRFNEISGSIDMDGESLAGLTFAAKASSVDTGIQRRDDHLRSPDFFNARVHPEIKFESTKVEAKGEGLYHVTGKLSLLGKSKTITVPVKLGGPVASQNNQKRAGLDVTFEIKRSDFGMTYGIENGALSDEVTLMLGAEFVK